MHAEISLVQVGTGMDVAGFGYDGFIDDQRQTIVTAIHEAMISRTELLMRSMKEWRRRPRHTHLARADASACSASITSERRMAGAWPEDCRCSLILYYSQRSEAVFPDLERRPIHATGSRI
jgi:hypothetical protein